MVTEVIHLSVLGENLKSLREKRGWSQIYVANKLGMKRSSTYANWEYGIRDPDTEMLSKLADLFEVDTDDLLGRSKKEDEYTPSENEYERLLRETEEKYNVNLRDDPVALKLYQELLVGIAKTKLDNK